MSNKIQMPPLNQMVWIFEAAREHFSEQVREMQSDIIRLQQFPEVAPKAEQSWVSRRKPATELIESKVEAVNKYLPLIEFCDQMREKLSDASSAEFAKAFRHTFEKGNK